MATESPELDPKSDESWTERLVEQSMNREPDLLFACGDEAEATTAAGTRQLRSATGRWLASVLLAIVLPQVTHADDLLAIVRQYEAATLRARSLSGEAQSQAQSDRRDLIAKSGRVDTPDSISFLLSEMQCVDPSEPEIATACVEALFASAREETPWIVLLSFPRCDAAVQTEILRQLAMTERDIAAYASLLLRIARGVTDLEVKRHLPSVLAKLRSAAAVEVLISRVGGAEGEAEVGTDTEYRDEVCRALKDTRDVALLDWLADEAFGVFQSSPSSLSLLARLCGRLEVEGARGNLESLLRHPARRVVIEALQSLCLLGTEPSSAILESFFRERNTDVRGGVLRDLVTGEDEARLRLAVHHAHSSDVLLRELAVRSLRHLEGSRAVESLVATIGDRDERIAAVARDALMRRQDKAAVGFLIGFLDVNQGSKGEFAALDLLVRLTGRNLGFAAEDWRRWWQSAEARFEIPADGNGSSTFVPLAPLVARTWPRYFGIEVKSGKASFLLDISSSMRRTVELRLTPRDDEASLEGRSARTRVDAGIGRQDQRHLEQVVRLRKIDVLKRELVRLLSELPDHTEVNLVPFCESYRAWQQQLQPLGDGGRQSAVRFAQHLETCYGTNISDTLEFALCDGRVDTVFLLSDGLPTAGTLREPERILKYVAIRNQRQRVKIHCLAIGAESTFLRSLAAQNGGTYRFVTSLPR